MDINIGDIVSLNSNYYTSSGLLGVHLTVIDTFPDGEIIVKCPDNIRNGAEYRIEKAEQKKHEMRIEFCAKSICDDCINSCKSKINLCEGFVGKEKI